MLPMKLSKPTKLAIKAMKIAGLNIHEVAGFYFAIGFSAGYDIASKSAPAKLTRPISKPKPKR
jgi:hypothetical protein